MKRASAKQACCGRVWPAGAYSSHQCSKTGSLQHEDRWYCKTHHPPSAEERRSEKHNERQAAWHKRVKAENQEYAERAELLRKAGHFNDLLDALQDCREALRRAGAVGELGVVDAVIAKVTGEGT